MFIVTFELRDSALCGAPVSWQRAANPAEKNARTKRALIHWCQQARSHCRTFAAAGLKPSNYPACVRQRFHFGWPTRAVMFCPSTVGTSEATSTVRCTRHHASCRRLCQQLSFVQLDAMPWHSVLQLVHWLHPYGPLQQGSTVRFGGSWHAAAPWTWNLHIDFPLTDGTQVQGNITSTNHETTWLIFWVCSRTISSEHSDRRSMWQHSGLDRVVQELQSAVDLKLGHVAKEQRGQCHPFAIRT